MNETLQTESKIAYLDMEIWERAEHFTFFQSLCSSNYGVTIQQDVTQLFNYRKEQNHGSAKTRFSSILYYLATRVANEIPEFRTRIVDGKPAIFDVIHPAFTYIPKGRSLHANCLCRLGENYVETAANIEIARQKADGKPTLTPVGGDKPNLFYFSVLNDVAFTSVSNPWGNCNTDSIPRINFGQVTENESGNQIIPVAVEVLHSFIDGRHLGEFFRKFDEMCKKPREYL